MKIFFDVNVVLDIAIKRTKDPGIFNKLTFALESGKIKGYVTTGLIQTVSYFLLKYLDYNKTREILTIIVPMFHFLDGDEKDILNALRMDSKDIEDAIFYQISLSNQIDAIVTSDKDFLKLSNTYLPVLTPEELVRRLD
ncbi:Predicted nucleic acid-binding protein, contains PIN domain [Algoriphagus ornithinivorans]|uniref:Predicted nucleic acid-binding protein, contains PIN domain n=1 Tax=Algoriphagus ornithinivorans TaxID=226506 RepID=A0A1I5ITA5_9BACT|nr:PIN domain-containing protein [Algoriphagus ornithinivorans]SFO63805.1 Predicted nucleic acid-binding protein, contains PIN domain [Algoriphagus ornithinivorans]